MIKLALLTSLAGVLALIAYGIRYRRALDSGRTRDQRADSVAVAVYRRQLELGRVVASSLPAIRSWAEIADDGQDPTAKTLEQWLAEDERILLRAAITEDLRWWSGWRLRLDARAEERAEVIARTKMGYSLTGLAGLRADLMIEACKHEGVPTSTMADSAVGWPVEWEDELRKLLSEGVRA